MGDPSGVAEAEAKSRKANDYSSALAEKLLQGWTLLDDHCHQCLVPLVRNRHRRMYCVACEQWVIRDPQVCKKAGQLGDEEAKKEDAIHPTHSQSDAAPDKEVHLEGSDVGLNNLNKSSYGDKATNPDACGCRCHMEHYDIVIPKVNVPDKANLVLSNTLSVLIHKLEEIRCALATSQNVHELKHLLSVLGEILQLIGQLKTLGMVIH